MTSAAAAAEVVEAVVNDNSQESTAVRQIRTVKQILTKRKFIDWTKANPDVNCSSMKKGANVSPYEYLIQWETESEEDEGMLTWEPEVNLASIKDRLRNFNDAFEKHMNGKSAA